MYYNYMLPTVELAAGSLPLVVIGCQKNLHQATTATPQNAGRMWKKTGYLVGGFNHLEKYESQWEGLSHILWKIKNAPNHQPDMKLWGNYQPWHEETRDVVHPCLHPKWKKSDPIGTCLQLTKLDGSALKLCISCDNGDPKIDLWYGKESTQLCAKIKTWLATHWSADG